MYIHCSHGYLAIVTTSDGYKYTGACKCTTNLTLNTFE